MASTSISKILSARLLAVVRLADYGRGLEVAQALAAGGLPVLEYTLTGQGALGAIHAARDRLGAAVCVGAGSVLTRAEAEAAIDAGAEFLVTPAMRLEVIAVGQRRAIPVLCGAFTPTELLAAHEAGCELVKLFPARLGGPAYLKDVLAPLPFLKLVPTGGVSAENLTAYFAAGAAAVGLGGRLVSAQAVAAGDFAQVTAAAQACVAALPPARL